MSEKGKLELSIKNLVKNCGFAKEKSGKELKRGSKISYGIRSFLTVNAVEFVKANQILIIRLENVGHKLEQLKG